MNVSLANNNIDSEFIPTWVKHIPFLFSIFALAFSYYFYSSLTKFSYDLVLNNTKIKDVFGFFNKKWLFDLIYNNILVKGVLTLSYKGTFKSIDRGLLEFFGSQGVVSAFSFLSKKVSSFQTGYIYTYAFVFAVGLFLTVIVAVGFFYAFLGLVITGFLFYLVKKILF